jgi:tRNA-specific 2-thiouridylase
MWGGLEARELNLLVEPEELPKTLEVQVRYRTKPVQGVVELLEGGRMRVQFAQPQFAVTPGQSVVLYQGSRLLGGGFIARPLHNQLEAGALRKSLYELQKLDA